MHNYKISYIKDKTTINNQACIMTCMDQAMKYAKGAGLILAKAISDSAITGISISSGDQTSSISL